MGDLRYPVASLQPKTVEQLRKFEAELKSQTGEGIVLIAYEQQSADSAMDGQPDRPM